MPRFVVAITGASGAPYAARLLPHLPGETYLIISEDARKVIRAETDLRPEELEAKATAAFRNDDFSAPPASGSARFGGMVIVPCSMTTMAKIAVGIGDNLITRAAAVCLKERRTLILVPRETPLGEAHLENMLKLSRMGAVILPAMPGFYHRPRSVEDLVDFVVARILDHLGVDHSVGPRWGQAEA
jgi:4-hydroxy-3-polyprenylbenzoate decarboxylase